MIVAQLERPLLGQIHPVGVGLAQLGHQLRQLLIVEDLFPLVQFSQMLLRQIYKCRKDHTGGGGGGTEVFVTDGGLDARVGIRLDGFQHREQPPQDIGFVIGILVQGHS